jgi:hypothetical protein
MPITGAAPMTKKTAASQFAFPMRMFSRRVPQVGCMCVAPTLPRAPAAGNPQVLFDIRADGDKLIM